MSKVADLRREQCGRYHEENGKYFAICGGRCEFERFGISRFKIESFCRFERGFNLPVTQELHHILGRGTVYCEHPTNYILLRNSIHQWGHNNSWDLKVFSLAAKFQKRIDGGFGDAEFDPNVLAQILAIRGSDDPGLRLASWLEYAVGRVSGELEYEAKSRVDRMVKWLRSGDGLE